MRILLSQFHAAEFLIRALKAQSAALGMYWQPAMVREGTQRSRAEHVPLSHYASERVIVRQAAVMFDVDRSSEILRFTKTDATLALGLFCLQYLHDLDAEPVQVEVLIFCFLETLEKGHLSERSCRFAEEAKLFDCIINVEERTALTELEKVLKCCLSY